MRLAALTLLALGLSATAAAGNPPAGSLSIEGGRGVIQVSGKGAVLGKIGKGSLEIVDLTAGDQWSPLVNGIPRGHRVWLRGKNVSFRVPAGRYRIVARGIDISISAQGSGNVVLDGDPDAVGDTGLYSVNGATCFGADMTGCLPLPSEATKASFGKGDSGVPSSQSVKIQP